MTRFYFLEGKNGRLSRDVNATIDHGTQTINATLPYDSNVTALIAEFKIVGASVSVNS